MDYPKIYQQLINRAKSRTIADYKETHHIVPRCLGGSDEPSNLVELTPEEHYVAHQLLVKIHTNHPGLVYAAVKMCSNRMNNKLYGWLRRRLSNTQSQIMSGTGNTMYNKRWVANEKETILVESADAIRLINSGNYIAGKIAKKAQCGCLVRKRCITHERKREITTEKRRTEFKQHAKNLFEEFVKSEVKSITQFAKLKNTSQPALTQIWKKHVPEYSLYVSHGKSLKETLTIK